MAKGTQVVKKDAALPSVPDYGQDAGTGFEGTKGSDLSIPFLAILQSNSPQVEEGTVEGAKPGMLFNTVTGELIDGAEGFVFLPVHKEHAYVEWVPRTKGGGFVALHDPDDQLIRDAKAASDQTFGRIPLDNGNELTETHYVYGLILDADGGSTVSFGVISFTSTKIKPYRDWFTSMYTLKGRPPLFANRARIKTTKQKNEKGTYFNFHIEPLRKANERLSWIASLIDPKTEAHLLDEAKDFRDMVMNGVARAAFETQAATTGDGSEGDGDAPF